MTHDEAPVPCIIDTDPGVDDVLALLLALSSPHLLILSITLTHGNCTLSSASSNLQKLFYALERQLEADQTGRERERYCNVDPAWRKRWGAGPIEVYLGSEGPVEGEAVTAKYFHGKDGLGDAATRHPDLTPPPSHTSSLFTLHASTPALEGVSSLLSRHPAQLIAYVALGPLTSLAQLHRATVQEGKMRESALGKFAVIMSMGGAVEHPGNTSPVAEFNYYADPFAAQTIFSLALPNLYILPLDLTSYLTLPFSLYASAVDPSFSSTRSPSNPATKSPLTHFTTSFLERTVEIMRSFGGDAMELHDPTVLYCLIDWARNGRRRNGASERGFGVDGVEGEVAPGWAWRHYDFEVETIGAITRGMLVRDLRASSRSSTSLTSRTGLTLRTAAIDALDIEEVEAHRAEGEASREQADVRRRRSGARVVIGSPGSEKLRGELVRNVWGVEVD
ncbi:hypothetical protein JCM10296v2_000871 [Rhodotorula toruloides]